MRQLVTIQPDEPVSQVIHKLKEHDISQLPVVNAEGDFLGLVTEVDLLNHLVLGDGRSLEKACWTWCGLRLQLSDQTPRWSQVMSCSSTARWRW